MTAIAESLALAVPELRLDLAALRWGNASAPALVALHGWLDNAGSFASLAPLMAPYRHVVAPDLPGHGLSAHLPPAGRYDLPLYVRVLHGVLDALGIGSCDLLGHSLGGAIASLYAAAHPRRIRRLLLIEALGPIADDGSGTLARWRDAMADGRASAPRTFRSPEAALAARCRATGQQPAAIRAIVERGVRQHHGGWTWRSDARLTAATPMRMAEAQVRALLAGISAPTLLLLGEPESPFLPHSLLRSRADCLRDIEIDAFAGGHHLHCEKPADVAARLLGFL